MTRKKMNHSSDNLLLGLYINKSGDISWGATARKQKARKRKPKKELSLTRVDSMAESYYMVG